MNKPIVVTGLHRSGSSWVGEVLCYSKEVEYIWEPFSYNYYPPLVRQRPPCWYLYIREGHQLESIWEDNIRAICDFKYELIQHMKYIRGLRDFAKVFRDWYCYREKQKKGAIPLLKDPIALFSAPWLERKFGAKIVVTVRHPCAFADSIIRPQWYFDWSNLLNQDELMNDYLADYRAILNGYKSNGCDLVDTAILLWNMMYGFVYANISSGANWHVVLHEDVVERPIVCFQQAFNWLGLKWTKELTERVAKIKKVDTKKWQKNLSVNDTNRILSGTEALRSKFYM